jgi:coenzyme F420-reducing hydrogenase delta subunit
MQQGQDVVAPCLEWVSASEGERWQTVVNDMTEKVRALGPFPRQTGAQAS